MASTVYIASVLLIIASSVVDIVIVLIVAELLSNVLILGLDLAQEVLSHRLGRHTPLVLLKVPFVRGRLPFLIRLQRWCKYLLLLWCHSGQLLGLMMKLILLELLFFSR